MDENVTSIITLWTGTVAAHSVGSQVTFLVFFLFFPQPLVRIIPVVDSFCLWDCRALSLGHLFHEAVLFQLSSSPAMHVPYYSTSQSAPLTCTRALKHMSKKCILHKSIFMSHTAYKGLSSVSHGSPSSQPAFQPFSEHYTYVGIL